MSQPAHAPVLSLEELADRVRAWQQGGLRVAHCHGRFDPLHAGHIMHFEEAAALADELIVTITPDRFSNSAPGRPLLTDKLRARTVACIRCVSLVAVNRWPSALELLEILKPDIYVKGVDYRTMQVDAFVAERRLADRFGIEVRLTGTPKFSSTELIEQLRWTA
ncbi:MAG TPA: adenylyltransferase/cytidyltransferase family protein [Allosphingosinicella sp.]|jgi:cytidyltransferase-like protein|nr:adenylyltransferase/cytidyltransferase family protein [Allosphingosinicella sp.]